MERNAVYPFTAIVGQEDMKLALILNVINPALGGVLIKGEKGTAKSTAVRALAELLPAMESVEGCTFHCNPALASAFCDNCSEKIATRSDVNVVSVKMRVVELPVSATEDRVVGTLDIEHAIKHGEKKFEPGILALANRNILYVDEINLLDDHVVDVLLDAAAMGINTVEREGVSYSHPARFVLVGTMNPEEGDIRPQLLDRFGLSVVVKGEHDPEQRVEVIKRRLAYEKDPKGFNELYGQAQNTLADQIICAQKILPTVEIDDHTLETVAGLSLNLGVDGHRADITVIKTALTLAAYAGRTKVQQEDLKIAAKLVLPHRMRRRPFEEGELDWQSVEAFLDENK
ncbi:MAG TPA: ATP-binding protein [Candidatus Avacidaminococcus intestinavium]|uniref:Mg-protoporphyrin IX chelatase n=1 Tax=Candidatus Avacidaminococcus intestinavium TaxID=2840684 RepID=A0A9D1MN58_9FIRM|nr:ATP-binding protein [Candidatus Avacidaminococcus intestinavium]